MKTNLELTLTGKDWWAPFLGFWIPFLLVYILQLRLPQWGLMESGRTGLYFLVTLVFMFLIIILQSIFMVIFFRIALPKLSIGGKGFSFKGDTGKYLGMNLLGMFLSIITVTIYIPWYARRITAYLVSETAFDGAAPEFLGKGGRLFTYMLLCLWIPIIVLCVIIGLAVGFSFAGNAASVGAGGTQLITMLTTFAIMIFIMGPFYYLMYKWFVNLRWNDVTITWKTAFWPSVGFILGQIALTIITIGIYWPAAILKLYRYFTAKTVLSRGEAELGRLGFEGAIGKGFGLLWGQTLLSIITLGIYIPWACSNSGRWILASTYCETTEQGAVSTGSIPGSHA